VKKGENTKVRSSDSADPHIVSSTMARKAKQAPPVSRKNVLRILATFFSLFFRAFFLEFVGFRALLESAPPLCLQGVWIVGVTILLEASGLFIDPTN
jgi:hypothetical protein